MRYAPSTEQIGRNVITFCSGVLRTTLADADRVTRLDQLGRLSVCVEQFVRGFARIEDPNVDMDDEILNWTFTECSTDLTSAIWLLASGFYKASASSLRNALDIATAALYFQVREKAHIGLGWNKFYTEWDLGKRQTPNWGEMKSVLTTHPSVVAFTAASGRDLVEEAHGFFKHLCGYTHTSAYDSRGNPVTAINFSGTAPAFDAGAFDRGCGLTEETMAHIAMLWQVTFPAIAGTNPLGNDCGTSEAALFPPPVGPLVLNHK